MAVVPDFSQAPLLSGHFKDVPEKTRQEQVAGILGLGPFVNV